MNHARQYIAGKRVSLCGWWFSWVSSASEITVHFLDVGSGNTWSITQTGKRHSPSTSPGSSTGPVTEAGQGTHSASQGRRESSSLDWSSNRLHSSTKFSSHWDQHLRDRCKFLHNAIFLQLITPMNSCELSKKMCGIQSELRDSELHVFKLVWSVQYKRWHCFMESGHIWSVSARLPLQEEKYS
jgi:hypothetical protein